VVEAPRVEAVVATLAENGERARAIGSVVSITQAEPPVRYV